MLNIHPMTKRDKPSVLEILHTLPEFKPSEVAVAEELIDCYLRHSPDYHLLVAELEAKVVGYICYGPAPLTEGTWDIYWIAVTLERQRQGIGSALLASAEDEIRRAQGRTIFIDTSSQPSYEKTRGFYLKHGYEVVCQIADFYAVGDDKLILRKRLK